MNIRQAQWAQNYFIKAQIGVLFAAIGAGLCAVSIKPYFGSAMSLTEIVNQMALSEILLITISAAVTIASLTAIFYPLNSKATQAKLAEMR